MKPNQPSKKFGGEKASFFIFVLFLLIIDQKKKLPFLNLLHFCFKPPIFFVFILIKIYK